MITPRSSVLELGTTGTNIGGPWERYSMVSNINQAPKRWYRNARRRTLHSQVSRTFLLTLIRVVAFTLAECCHLPEQLGSTAGFPSANPNTGGIKTPVSILEVRLVHLWTK